MKYLFVLLLVCLFYIPNFGQPQYCTATGTNALGQNVNGGACTATGYQSLYNQQTVWNNTGFGAYALEINIWGESNTGFGALSLAVEGYLGSSVKGMENTALGYLSLGWVIEGSRNTGVGTEALRNAYRDYNSAIGYRTLYSTSSGSNNVAIGSFAGWTNTTGNNNTYIGSGADNYSTSYWETLHNNTTVIGGDTHRTANDVDNKITIGNNISSIGGEVSWTNFSDKRIKKDLQENVPGVSFIKLLRPVSYKIDVNAYRSFLDSKDLQDSIWRSTDVEAIKKSADEAYGNISFSGFLAQEVEVAAEKSHYSFSGVQRPQHEGGLYSVSYEQFVVPLTKAAQEIDAKNILLKDQVNELKEMLSILETQIAQLRSSQKNP